MKQIYLSPPDMSVAERRALLAAFDSNWIAPVGPDLRAFEEAMCARVARPHAVALSSGTAGLHLALQILGVERGDTVITSSLTFAATANAAMYVGAEPIFVDCDATSWNMDPDLLEEALAGASRAGRVPKAVITVDLYGQCADYRRIVPICERYGVPIIEDAAEALGATLDGRPAGSFGAMAVLSFNGNKIITTGGGGMLLANDPTWIEEARFLATQARDPAPHYQHTRVGYNYRLSNLLAALGTAQLGRLDQLVAARRAHNVFYRSALDDLPGISFMPEIEGGASTFWLTCLTIDREALGVNSEVIRLALQRTQIEARPVWKPMHLQPVFSDCRVIGGGVSADLFERGLCLPSGSSLSPADRNRVVTVFREAVESGAR